MTALAAALVGLQVNGASAEHGRAQHSMGRYVIVLQDSARDRVDAIVDEHRRRFGEVPGFVYRHAIVGYSALVPESQVSRLRNDPRVAMVAPDNVIRADQQILPTGVDRVEADQSSTLAGNGSGSVNVGVAILDTGIDLTHPDLNVVGGTTCVGPGLPGVRPPEDDNGHGTHVAGTVAARDNDADVVGVAPGAPLYAVKVLNAGGFGRFSNMACGLDWVAANAQSNNIKVVNMSIGGNGSDDGNCGRTNNDVLHLAICRVVDAGVTVVVAAGNDARDFAGQIPAAYDEVLTVTAMQDADGRPGGLDDTFICGTGPDDRYAGFSNFTAIGSADAAHTIAGPGVCILSTGFRRGNVGSTAVLSGTSMAAPHVAGTAALCLTGPCAGMTPAQIIQKLRTDAANAAAPPAAYGFGGDPNAPVNNRYYGHLTYAGAY